MAQRIEINADLRKDVGKGASRRLRRLAEKVPGIMYGGGDEPIPLIMKQNELSKAMQQEAFYSQVLDVVVGGKTQQAVVRDLQRNPSDDRVIHIDFLRVSADKLIQVQVPLHFLNEDKCVGVRQEAGLISHNMNELEVSCLPKDLPEFIEIDMENVSLNQVIHLTDLNLPEGVEIVALMHGEDRDANVVSVQAPRGGADEFDEVEETLEGDAEVDSGDDPTAEDNTPEDSGDE